MTGVTQKIADGYRTAEKEWQCPTCGAWIDAGWWRHSHVTNRNPTASEMIAARERGDLDPLTSAAGEVVTYFRTGKEPRRDAP